MGRKSKINKEMKIKAYKYRIYPNAEQEVFFAKCFGYVRFFYNKSLDDMKKEYENNKTFIKVPTTYPSSQFYVHAVDIKTN